MLIKISCYSVAVPPKFLLHSEYECIFKLNREPAKSLIVLSASFRVNLQIFHFNLSCEAWSLSGFTKSSTLMRISSFFPRQCIDYAANIRSNCWPYILRSRKLLSFLFHSHSAKPTFPARMFSRLVLNVLNLPI